ncbi:MAG: DUF4157 domain-containing protein [Proteobacteria bacterium]|nr:DUF4157 domain-containing protein [Pseudomonadota bacterium]
MRSKSLARIQRAPLEEDKSCPECAEGKDNETIFRSLEDQSDDAFAQPSSNSFMSESISGANNIINLQAKLEIGEPDDELEKEADKVAEEVTGAQEEEKIQMQPKDKEAGLVQGKSDSSGGMTVSSDQAAAINSLRGGGMPLPSSTRGAFESRMGADFSNVRVHADPGAASSAKSLNAKAFTLGNEIFFNEGRYAPDSPDGKKLIAHELTHVVQQRGSDLAIQCSFLSDIWEGIKSFFTGTETVENPDEVEKIAGGVISNLKKADELTFVAEELLGSYQQYDSKSKMAEARGTLGSMISGLETAEKIVKGTRGAADLAQIVQKLDSISIEENPEEAARQFGRLFSTLGSMGDLLPGGPWSGYCEFLKGMDDLFVNVRKSIVPHERQRWKALEQQMAPDDRRAFSF